MPQVQLIGIYPDAHMYITSTYHNGRTINEFTVACHGLLPAPTREDGTFHPEGLLIDGTIWPAEAVAECIQSCTIPIVIEDA
ncbi:hypothetical protein [Xenorhabdus sp. Sc-CR9]|uniref:hypothetical protein n=1 Tax=Xenorhabdus sp. Sc-CR9 TaxID=2584468 RepID=UPI001F16D43C|nr:hypothetical protein [Xenorhabdus sp. Sc-CR9]